MTAGVGGDVDADDGRGGIDEGGDIGGIGERVWWNGRWSVLWNGEDVELGDQGNGQATVGGHLDQIVFEKGVERCGNTHRVECCRFFMGKGATDDASRYMGGFTDFQTR